MSFCKSNLNNNNNNVQFIDTNNFSNSGNYGIESHYNGRKYNKNQLINDALIKVHNQYCKSEEEGILVNSIILENSDYSMKNNNNYSSIIEEDLTDILFTHENPIFSRFTDDVNTTNITLTDVYLNLSSFYGETITQKALEWFSDTFSSDTNSIKTLNFSEMDLMLIYAYIGLNVTDEDIKELIDKMSENPFDTKSFSLLSGDTQRAVLNNIVTDAEKVEILSTIFRSLANAENNGLLITPINEDLSDKINVAGSNVKSKTLNKLLNLLNKLTDQSTFNEELLNTVQSQSNSLEVREDVKNSQLIGRTLAYKTLHEDLIVPISTPDDEVKLYKVSKHQQNGSFVADFFVPIDSNNAYVNSHKNTNVFVSFRGTDSLLGAKTDCDLTGVCNSKFEKEKVEFINSIKTYLASKDSDNNISLNIYGHSLGAAFSQRLALELVQMIDKSDDPIWEKISEIRLVPHNAPKIERDKARRFNNILDKHRDSVLFPKVSCTYVSYENAKTEELDIVQKAGAGCNLGYYTGDNPPFSLNIVAVKLEVPQAYTLKSENLHQTPVFSSAKKGVGNPEIEVITDDKSEKYLNTASLKNPFYDECRKVARMKKNVQKVLNGKHAKKVRMMLNL